MANDATKKIQAEVSRSDLILTLHSGVFPTGVFSCIFYKMHLNRSINRFAYSSVWLIASFDFSLPV